MVLLQGKFVINQGLMVVLYRRMVINQGIVVLLKGKLLENQECDVCRYQFTSFVGFSNLAVQMTMDEPMCQV